uniref:Uncharacterized protein n=1 Tax=Kalanchoe fedtschenkoi TaxID=63787 RepID=A0A7N0UMA1_KALFE
MHSQSRIRKIARRGVHACHNREEREPGLLNLSFSLNLSQPRRINSSLKGRYSLKGKGRTKGTGSKRPGLSSPCPTFLIIIKIVSFWGIIYSQSRPRTFVREKQFSIHELSEKGNPPISR